MTIEQYIEKIRTRYKSGISTEHSYRGDLQTLLESLCPDILATNEPTRVACGAPDYILTNKNIPVGYIEAKDIGANLKDKNYKEQFDRYKASLANLIFTDYLDFHLYQDGEFVMSVAIGEIENGKLVTHPEKFGEFENIIKDFATHVSQTIRSAEKLSKMMAGKAKMLATITENAVTADEKEESSKVNEDANNSLREQMHAFKQVLIHDISPKEFADIYAQTIAYGMFAARLHDPSLESFGRMEAAELIPKSNPFLRKLFQYVAGYDLDDRIKWIVDALADIFRATDVAAILKNFGKSTQQQDPIIHFYETFLAEYDPKLRKARGVWYTPEPVVNFIVRAVDDILKTEFGLKDGLADTSKTKVKIKTVTKATADARSKIKEGETEIEVHKVQILDPATGTGTFLAEIIKQVYKKFEGQQGTWSKYVNDHLIPRLNGFEILMASYAMAHLKLDLLLTETGYKANKDQRFRVYLTNSLEEYHPDTGTLFANWLSAEANEANHVKRDTPVMVVLGNPPYSVSSSNKGEWIQNLISDYKKDLNEKKINLDDDYIKFTRYGQYFIEKNGEGILAYISNNSFIDGITHRQMRKHLLETFDKIYILDLHGSAKKNETAPDGTKDENVFDIQQGVSINIFIKKASKKTNCEVFHSDVYGLREDKYELLLNSDFKKVDWENIDYKEPYRFFVPKNFDSEDLYNSGFKVSELLSVYNNGLQTDRDSLFIDFDKKNLKNRIKVLFEGNFDNGFKEFYRVEDSSSYKLLSVINKNQFDDKWVCDLLYRPFDFRSIYYDPKVISRPAQKVLKHFENNNIGLIISRQQSTFDFQHVLVTNIITERCSISLQTKETGYVFPLYLYPEIKSQQTLEGKQDRQSNLDKKIVEEIAKGLGLKFTSEKETTKGTFAPMDILDYIYAVLHSPTYREKYKEFLKIDFPRVPYPKDKDIFWKLVKFGGELRQIHLLESPVVEKYITKYPKDGSNKVDKISYEDQKVWINNEQYFDKVPQVAREFYIGGYQPAKKWLKDRKGRTLSYEDILHYQKIIVALTETDRIMKEIDKIEIE